jgi:hypothetical protein
MELAYADYYLTHKATKALVLYVYILYYLMANFVSSRFVELYMDLKNVS